MTYLKDLIWFIQSRGTLIFFLFIICVSALIICLLVLIKSYIYLCVVNQLVSNVTALILDCLIWEISIRIPVPAGNVSVGCSRRSMLNSGCGDNANWFPWNKDQIFHSVNIFAELYLENLNWLGSWKLTNFVWKCRTHLFFRFRYI